VRDYISLNYGELAVASVLVLIDATLSLIFRLGIHELSPNFGDGLRVQAAAVWAFEEAGLAATSIPSVNLTP
jgi:hypothetical protein